MQESINSPKVSVIVPVRNEELYIRECLESLLHQSCGRNMYEIIVLDGKSSDRSREIVMGMQVVHPNISLFENEKAIASSAMNVGIRKARGEIIIRADAHSLYPSNYIADCVKYLEETGAANVGGPWLTVPARNTFGARLVAAVLSSPFGVGDSKFRTSATDCFVKTVPFGAFRKEIFNQIGLYDENLVCNEDNDLNARIRRSGGEIYQASALKTVYHPVETFNQLLKKTFRTSQWHIFSSSYGPCPLNLRHFIPAAFVLALSTLGAMSIFSPMALGGLMALLTAYMLVGLSFAVQSWRKNGSAVTITLPFACFCFHIVYAVGTILGVRYLWSTPAPQPIRPGLTIQQGD